MKKILIALFILIGFVAKSQQLVPRAASSVQVQDARLQAKYNLIVPVYPDTATANIYKGLDSLGAIIQIRSTGLTYKRDTTAGGHKWTLLGAGPAPGIDDVLSINQPFSTSRNINQNNHDMTFDSVSYWGAISILSASNVSTIETNPNFAHLFSKYTSPTERTEVITLTGSDLDATGVNLAPISDSFFNHASGAASYIIATNDSYTQLSRVGVSKDFIKLQSDSLILSGFGAGLRLGTRAYGLAVTSNGDIIEDTTTGGGGGGGSDSGIFVNNTITKSISGTSIGLKVDTTVIASKYYVDHLTDSFTLRTPGTGTGAIPLAFSNAGALVIPKAAPGANIIFTVASDSLWTISSNAIGVDSVQAYTSGSTLTQTTGYNYIQLNPASVQAALTITTATTFHSSNDLYIVAGGTVTSGAVITSLTITAGSGLTLIQSVTPTTINAGEVIHYHKIGSFLYRIN